MKHQIRWTSKKIQQRLTLIESLVYRQKEPLPGFSYQALDGASAPPPIGADIDDSGWERIEPNTYWGTWQTTFVMRSTFSVPEDWAKNAKIALYLPLGEPGDFSHPEALAYLDGDRFAACDRHHQEIVLPESFHDGQTHRLELHGWTGLDGWFKGEMATKHFMRPCAVVLIDQPTRDFVAKARVALETADQLEVNEPARGLLLNALDDAFKVLDLREPMGEAFYASIPAAHQILTAGIEQAGPALNVTVIGSGHAHIDVAWLWDLAQTRLKAGRTFYNVLRLMEQFPDYHFTQSQPQLYEYISEDYPELIDAIKSRVSEGRWEPIGGMWVEADCNVSGGEALARQFLLGRHYFAEMFGEGVESPVLWLPDVFGYAWNLPQLIKEAGLEYFFTIKISWSQYNRMPVDTFWWQGLDGTKVLTHFSTTQNEWSLHGKESRRPTTYNANVSALEVRSTWTNLQQKESQQEMLMAYGYGDGGGGPTREMLENLREFADFPAMPKMQAGKAGDFFKRLEAQSGELVPTWNGELYLEYHRGTYTTQAKNKKGNRKGEILLHDAEFLATWAAMATGFEYPHESLTHAWKLLCLNQFHDILPGSSVPEVYEDSDQDYAEIQRIGSEIRSEALSQLGELLPAESQYVVANPTSFGGRKVGLLPVTLAEGEGIRELESGKSIPSQAVEKGTLIELDWFAPYSLKPLAISAESADFVGAEVKAINHENAWILENEWIQAKFNGSGELVSLIDKEVNRSVIASGEVGNAIQAFEDRPMNWDAWDIDIFYDDKQWAPESAYHIEIIENGPIRAGLLVKRRLNQSMITQKITLCRGSKQIDFETEVDWREKHVLLKVAFPVDVLSPTATFDIQWGNVERPTHQNTSWDWARFETCAHKWVDLSEGNYGVSLLNDCKYGHDVQGNVLRLTLLRAPTYPDPEADQGVHHFTYSLLPHKGDWREKTAAAAYVLNDPLIYAPVEVAGKASGLLTASLVEDDAQNIIIETVKQAEDGKGLIVRFYENERMRGPVTIKTSFEIAEAFRCNILEENGTALAADGNSVSVEIRPYQIVTLRLVPRTG